MKYDKPLVAVLLAMSVGIPVEIYTQIFKYFGLNQLSSFELTSIMMYSKGSWWVGLLTLFGTAGIIGLLMYEMARKLGTDYFAIKCAFVGTVTYGLIATIYGTLGKNPRFAELTVSGHYVQASAGLLGGLVAGLLIKKFLFSDNKITETKRVRRYNLVPSPALKKEQKDRKVRLIKPKKL